MRKHQIVIDISGEHSTESLGGVFFTPPSQRFHEESEAVNTSDSVKLSRYACFAGVA